MRGESLILRDIDLLRTVSLLHDIGKPLSWALGRPWSEHIYYTYDIVKEHLGENYAKIAMRHHSGMAYPKKYHPKSVEEKILWLADNLSSGADRREVPERGSLIPLPPFRLTHPLSSGDIEVARFNLEELLLSSQKIVGAIENAAKGLEKSPREGYLKVFNALENSNLSSIPADTRPPINDVSLWHHSKLTAAFATCIVVDGGWKGDDPSNYKFTMLSGDGDRISDYIMESKRIPDLNARSDKVRSATLKSAEKVVELVGPECLLFAGGGSLLALCPVTVVEEISKEVSEAFEEAMEGEASFTVSIVKESGNRMQRFFGEVWRKASRSLRISKLEKPVLIPTPLDSDVILCEVCHKRVATHKDELRYEVLCDICWSLRESGEGIWIESITKETNRIAVIKFDGDDVSRVLDGSSLKNVGKEVTPSRLSTLSSLINETCENKLRKIIESHKGRIIFAGGDDILALLPGEEAMDTAIELSYVFREAMNKRCTISAGIAIIQKRLPIYVGLERAHELISIAKTRTGKNAVAYTIVGGLGRVERQSERAISWEELDQILGIIGFFKQSEISQSQIRRIAKASIYSPDEAELLIKYLMGRKVISWEKGEELLSYLESGLLSEAFKLYNLFKAGL